MLREIGKVLAPTARALRLMLGRAVLQLVDDAKATQTVQFERFGGMVLDDKAERFAEYGFTSVPFAGAEIIAAFLAGTRQHPIVIATHDARYRLTGLAAGEVAIHDDQGQKVYLTRAGIVIDGGGKPVTITNTPKVRCETALFQVTGDIVDNCDAQPHSLADMRDIFDAHFHHEHDGPDTSAPTTEM